MEQLTAEQIKAIKEQNDAKKKLINDKKIVKK